MSRPRSAVPSGLMFAVTLAGPLVLLAGCDGGTDSEQVDRHADVYAAAIRDAIDDVPLESAEDPEDRVVHIYALDDDLSLEVQVEVLERLEDEATIRFVDDFEEAVAEDEDGPPVKRDGVAVGLGAPEGDDDVVEVRVERYTGGGSGEGIRYRARRTDSEWTVERRGSFEPEHPTEDAQGSRAVTARV